MSKIERPEFIEDFKYPSDKTEPDPFAKWLSEVEHSGKFKSFTDHLSITIPDSSGVIPVQ